MRHWYNVLRSSWYRKATEGLKKKKPWLLLLCDWSWTWTCATCQTAILWTKFWHLFCGVYFVCCICVKNVFCILYFIFLYFVFCILYFVFCILYFTFCILYFVFYILYFVHRLFPFKLWGSQQEAASATSQLWLHSNDDQALSQYSNDEPIIVLYFHSRNHWVLLKFRVGDNDLNRNYRNVLKWLSFDDVCLLLR